MAGVKPLKELTGTEWAERMAHRPARFPRPWTEGQLETETARLYGAYHQPVVPSTRNREGKEQE